MCDRIVRSRSRRSNCGCDILVSVCVVNIFRKDGNCRRRRKLGVGDARVLCVFKRALCGDIERFRGFLVINTTISFVFAKNAFAQNLFASVNPRDTFVRIQSAGFIETRRGGAFEFFDDIFRTTTFLSSSICGSFV